MLLPSIIIGACFCAGVLVTMAVLLSSPVKLADQDGLPLIEFLGLLALPLALSLCFLWLGAWYVAVPFVFMLGVVLAIPFCIHFAPYLDDLKAFLCTPQRPGKRKRVYPAYPKQERMQEQPLAYYEEMSQR